MTYWWVIPYPLSSPVKEVRKMGKKKVNTLPNNNNKSLLNISIEDLKRSKGNKQQYIWELWNIHTKECVKKGSRYEILEFVAGKEIAKTLIQDTFVSKNICKKINAILEDKNTQYRVAVKDVDGIYHYGTKIYTK